MIEELELKNQGSFMLTYPKINLKIIQSSFWFSSVLLCVMRPRKKYLMASKEERNQQEVSLCMLDIFFRVGKISEKFIEEWQNNKFKPYDSELNLLKEGCDEVLEAFDNHLKESLLFLYGKQRFDIQHAKVKVKVNKIRELIVATAHKPNH